MSQYDPVTKRRRMQCTNTEYWIKDVGYGLIDTGEACGEWFDSYDAYGKASSGKAFKAQGFAKGVSRKAQMWVRRV